MKPCLICKLLLAFVVVTVARTRHKRLRNRQVGASLTLADNFTKKRSAELIYISHDGIDSWPSDKEVYNTPNDGSVRHFKTMQRYKRDRKRTAHKGNQGKKNSNGSAQLPQPAKPLRVVATSAAIKNRLKKPSPLKAIHIWGSTPFKTVLANLRRLNANLRSQQGAVKRLFLPYRLHGINLAKGIANLPPPPGITAPSQQPFAPVSLKPSGPFRIAPNAIHLHEAPPNFQNVIKFTPHPLPLPPPEPIEANEVPDQMRFVPRPFPVATMSVPPGPPLTLPGPMPPAAMPPLPTESQVQDMAPMNDVAPVHEVAQVREIGSAPYTPPVHEIGPSPEMFSKSLDFPEVLPHWQPNIPPNMGPPTPMLGPPNPMLGPPNPLLGPPFPWFAGEIHEEVNRHVHKGKMKARCTPNPCKNDGTCTAFESHYECTCPIGFMGKHCEVVNHCLPNPCKNDGNCYATGNGYKCTCIKGFKGPNCDIANRCIPNPCKNGGSCDEYDNSYRCSCLPGFKGSNCQAADHCGVSNPCKNGGTCVNGERTFECHCLLGFNGADCGDLDVCYSNPCQNSGTCRNLGAGQFMCQCSLQFRGITCDERIPKCESQPCQNGGTCVEDDESGFHCICTEKYQGEHCQELRSACHKHPCLNGGKCVDHDDTFKCICTDGFDGTTCEVKLSTPPIVCTDCSEHAKCVDGKCICEEGYFGNGNVCEVVKGLEANAFTSSPERLSLVDTGTLVTSVCHPNPCYNGGVCHEAITGFTCSCPLSYIGPICKEASETNVCHPNPCYNGGTCRETITGFACSCPLNYIGPVCKEVSACLANPCLHGGTCIDGGLPGVYSCMCAEGYSGKNCEEL